MFGLNKYLILGLVLAVAAAALLGRLWLGARDDLAEMRIQYERQQAETAKAVAEIASLKEQHRLQLQVRAEQDKERSREIADLKRRNRDIQATSDTLSQALRREPDRAGRVISILDARSLREVCRASGGSADACKIDLPKPAPAGRGDPAQDRVGAGEGVGGKKPPGGGSLVHPKSRLR